MKKLLVFAVVAALFASCSNGEGDKKAVEGVTPDTSMMVKPDTTAIPDTTLKTPADTTTKP